MTLSTRLWKLPQSTSKTHFRISFWNGKSYTCIACQNFLVICEGRYTKTFIVLRFILFALHYCFICALLCCVFMFHCIMYYLLCNLIVHAWYLWTCTCMCYLCLYVISLRLGFRRNFLSVLYPSLYVNVLYVFM